MPPVSNVAGLPHPDPLPEGEGESGKAVGGERGLVRNGRLCSPEVVLPISAKQKLL
jgi:hypothetical protein